MSVSNVLISFLEAKGVRHIFGVSGAKIERFFHEVHVSSDTVDVIITKHEAVAVSAADSTAKCGADFGAVAVTSGGAAFNIVPGLAEAYAKNTPLFVIVGQPTNTINHCGGFQESSGKNGTPRLEDTLSSVSRWCKTLNSAGDIAQYLSEIDDLLLSKRSGPAVLLVPENVFEEPAVVLPSLSTSGKKEFPISVDIPESLDLEKLVVIVGSEVLKQGAYADLNEMLDTLQLPTVTVSDAKHCVNTQAGYYAGAIGAMGHTSAFELMQSRSKYLVIGARFREIDRLALPFIAEKECYFVGRDKPFIDSYHFLGEDIKQFCALVKEKYEAASEKQKLTIPTKEYAEENLYVETLAFLNEEMKEPVNILVDAGNGGAYTMHYLFPPSGSIINIALTMGGMGYSFGAALGAALYNGRRTYQLAGDGSFFMHGFEIETALRLSLPITYVVFDNSGHQMCVTREELFFNENSGNNSFLDSRVGKGFQRIFDGLPSFDIYSIEQLKVQFAKYQDHKGPLLFVIHVHDEDIPPFLPFERG